MINKKNMEQWLQFSSRQKKHELLIVPLETGPKFIHKEKKSSQVIGSNPESEKCTCRSTKEEQTTKSPEQCKKAEIWKSLTNFWPNLADELFTFKCLVNKFVTNLKSR